MTTKINFLSTGVCDVTATQAGNAAYNSASTTQRITVGSLNQTITFAQITDKTFGNPNFRLGATSNSGLTVTYRLGHQRELTGLFGKHRRPRNPYQCWVL